MQPSIASRPKPNGGDPVSKDVEIDGAAIYRVALSIKPAEISKS